MELVLTAILVLLALAILGTMLFMQVRYKQQVAARERLMLLSTENKKLQALQRSLPADYLSHDLQDFIFRTLIGNYQTMLDLDKSNNRFLRADLDRALVQRRALAAGSPQAGSTDNNWSVDQANAARAGLKALYQYIKLAYQQRQLVRTEAQKLLDEIERRLLETGADFYNERAAAAYRQNRYKEAIVLYRKSQEALGNSRLSHLYKQRINEARLQIRRIQNEWREINRARNEEQTEKMNEQLAEWAAEQDSWKKKQLYDDD